MRMAIWGAADRRFWPTNLWKKKKVRDDRGLTPDELSVTFPQLFGSLLYNTITETSRVPQTARKTGLETAYWTAQVESYTSRSNCWTLFEWDFLNRLSHSLTRRRQMTISFISLKTHMGGKTLAADEEVKRATGQVAEGGGGQCSTRQASKN